MAALTIGLLIIGMIVSFIGGIMFLIVSFRVSVMWGLLVLFVPFASLVFLVKYWPEAKKSFFVNLGGAAVMGVAAFLMVTSAVSAGGEATNEAAMRPASEAHGAAVVSEARGAAAATPGLRPGVKPAPPGPEDAQVTAEEAARAASITTEDVEPAPANEVAEIDEAAAFDKLKEAPAAALISEEVKAADLPHFIGQRLLVVEHSGRELRGTLLSVDPRTLRIERELSGGSVSYNVARADVKEVRSLN